MIDRIISGYLIGNLDSLVGLCKGEVAIQRYIIGKDVKD